MKAMEANVKRLIPVVVVGLLLTVGCAKTKKAEPQPMAAPPTEYAPPPAPVPAPEPAYTPIPQAEPTIVTPAPTAPAPVQTVQPAPTVRTAPAPKTSTSSKVYVVKKGDTLSEIAKANKTTVKQIMTLNPSIKKADMIYSGQKLKMP